MRRFFLPFLFLPLFLQAQLDDSFPNQTAKRKNRWALTFSPLALAQIDYTLLAGAEYRLKPRLHVATDVGYIFSSSYLERDGNKMRQATGFLFRPGLKYFPSAKGNYYLHPQIFYKQVTHAIYDWLDKAVVNGVPTYQQLQDFRYRRKVIGFNAIFGVMLSLGRSDRLYADVYLGAGVRQKTFEVVGEKTSRYNNTGMGLWREGQDGSVLPSLPMGVRFYLKL